MSYVLAFATLTSFISSFIPVLIKPVLACIFVESKVERHLRYRISCLRIELLKISAVDSFAKYARTEREINKVADELKTIANKRRQTNVKLKFGITSALRIFMAIVMVSFVWIYKATPVIVLPKDWLFPLSSIMSWPTGQEGAVSVTTWVLVTETVMQMAAAAVRQPRFLLNSSGIDDALQFARKT